MSKATICNLVVLLGCAALALAQTLAPVGRPSPIHPAAAQPADKARSQAAVEALIKQAGETAPDWWNSVPLSYPSTLDLTWNNPPKGSPWTPSKWLGQYIWGVINENPHRWKEGAKLLHHTLTVNKNDPEKLRQSMNALGRIYGNLLQDYARAAYWWRKANVGAEADVDLANCYWQLGCKDMAKAELMRYGKDDTRHGAVIKLWADIGELNTALKLAEQKAKDGMPYIAWMAAGDACRQAGQYPQAIVFYERSLAAPQGGRDIKQSRERAQSSLVAINLYDRLDLKRIPDGVYTNESSGYAGPVAVAVTMKAGRIEAVTIVKHHEKQFYGSLTATPAKIIAKQSIKGIDMFSGATVTSEAIVNATAKALASGVR